MPIASVSATDLAFDESVGGEGQQRAVAIRLRAARLDKRAERINRAAAEERGMAGVDRLKGKLVAQPGEVLVLLLL